MASHQVIGGVAPRTSKWDTISYWLARTLDIGTLEATNLLDHAIEHLASRQVLQHHVVETHLLGEELVDLHHVRVIQYTERVDL